MHDLARVWESSKSLFSHKKIEETFRKELPNSDLRFGILIFGIAGLLTAAISLASTIELAYFGLFQLDTISEITGAGEPALDIMQFLPDAAFWLIFFVPFSIVYSLAYEGLLFGIFRFLKGKGTFAKQLYLSSIVSLSIAIASLLSLLFVFPGLNCIAGPVFILIGGIYLGLYVNSKAYEIAHDLPFMVTILMILAFAIPRILLMALIITEATAFMGLSSTIDFSGVEYVPG